MSRISLEDWIQMITGFAILIGLVLVMVELTQTRTLAEIQLIRDGYAEHFAYQRQVMGENPAPILTKACFSPSELTNEEITVVLAYYDYRYESIMQYKTIAERAGKDSYWRDAAVPHLKAMLALPLGRVEYEKYKDDPNRWDPAVAALATSILAQSEEFHCEELHNTLRGELSKI